MTLTRTAHAKINLFLRIVRRRTDGYHDIETLFQRISLADFLTFETTDDGTLTLSATGIAVPGAPGDNLILRAARALQEAAANPQACGARIALDKRIPTGGGLGGGSCDAAATLLALRDLWALDLTDAALREIGRRLGADVPFCVGSEARAIGRGVGDELCAVPTRAPSAEPPAETSSTPPVGPSSPLPTEPFSAPPLKPFRVVLALPDYGVPTAEVYRRYDPARPEPCDPERLPRLIEALARGDLEAALQAAWNEMEGLAFALRPELGALRRRLEERASRPVRMSGSGSTLFTLADSDADADGVATAWQGEAPAARVQRFL